MKSPVDLKIERAHHHAEQLLRELETFRKRQPYLVREHREEWRGNAYRVVTAYQPEDVPECVPLILGDFIQNLRASLDYLVGAMRVDGPSRTSAFPIYTRKSAPGGFLDNRKRKLTGIPIPAQKLIERMQPYDRRYGRPRKERVRWEVLEVLETLWNVDKHRTILLATSVIASGHVGHNRPGEEESGIGWRLSPAGNEADWWLPIDDRDQDFDPHFSVEVALTKPRGFAEDWPTMIGRLNLDGLVNHLYNKVVHDVVPHFRQFIQQGA